MRAIPTAAAVEAPATVNLANPEHLSICSPASFGICDPLTGVLRYFVSLTEGNGGEAASAVYWRRLDCQSMGQLHSRRLLELEGAGYQIRLIAYAA